MEKPKELLAKNVPVGSTSKNAVPLPDYAQDWNDRLGEATRSLLAEFSTIEQSLVRLDPEAFETAVRRRAGILETVAAILSAFRAETARWPDREEAAEAQAAIDYLLESNEEAKKIPDLVRRTKSVLEETRAATQAVKRAEQALKAAKHAQSVAESRKHQLEFALIKKLYTSSLRQGKNARAVIKEYFDNRGRSYDWRSDVEPYLQILEGNNGDAN